MKRQAENMPNKAVENSSNFHLQARLSLSIEIKAYTQSKKVHTIKYGYAMHQLEDYGARTGTSGPWRRTVGPDP